MSFKRKFLRNSFKKKFNVRKYLTYYMQYRKRHADD